MMDIEIERRKKALKSKSTILRVKAVVIHMPGLLLL